LPDIDLEFASAVGWGREGEVPFSKVDMSKGYWLTLIPVREENPKTAFTTQGLGQFQKTFPFGLQSAVAAVFSRMARKLLSGTFGRS